MLHHPAMQILHIRDGVHFAPGLQHVCILGVQGGADDAGLVFAGLEVRIGEAEEDFLELRFGEEVGEEFHGVGADAGDVLVGWCWCRARVLLLLPVGDGLLLLLGSEGFDLVLDELGDGGADFHA